MSNYTSLDGYPLDPAIGMMHQTAYEVWLDSDRYGDKPRAAAAYCMSLAVEVQDLRNKIAELSAH